MSESYVPTVAQVGAAYINTRPNRVKAVSEFERWLRERDASGAAEALRWAANFGIVIVADENGDESARSLQERSRARLLDEAARIEREARRLESSTD